MAEARIVPRNEHFAFDTSLPVHWHSADPAITHFYDALSLTFPEGERFFVDSVRAFTDRITDPALKADVAAFTAQESIHSREHAHYNALIAKRGIPVEKVERLMRDMVRWLQKHLSAEAQLAATCAYEHYTALFAEVALSDRSALEGAHPVYRDLWRWHAMEEQEHKSVAFDVYAHVAPGFRGYLRRVLTMLIATADFFITIPLLDAWLMRQHGEFWRPRSWGRAFWHLWVSPGVWRKVVAGVGAYLLPGFHPSKRTLAPSVLEWRERYRPGPMRDPGADTAVFAGESD
jgi:predicted metal-dependent hydrolase